MKICFDVYSNLSNEESPLTVGNKLNTHSTVEI